MHPDSNSYLAHFTSTLATFPHAEVAALIQALHQARQDGATIFVLGNGGSGATASHWVCDMNKGASYGAELRFRMISLCDNFPTVMAYSNDVSYEVIFVEQLKNFLKPGDLVIGISGSGNSPNVIRAIEYANEQGAMTVGLSGYSGGQLRAKSKLSVHFPVSDMQMVEDLHMMTAHICMQASATGDGHC